MLDEAAATWGDNVALVDGDTRITYSQLVDRRNRMAAGLAEIGVHDGTRVGLYLGESWQHAVLVHALLHRGAIIVPINLSWEPREILFALQQSQAEVLVVGREYRGRSLWSKLRDLGIDGAGDVECVRAPHLRSVLVQQGEQVADGTESLEHVIERGDRLDTPAPSQRQESYIIYTSGRWSFPRGAVFRQDVALGSSHYVCERMGLTDLDHFLNLMPFYHPGGLIHFLLACPQRGTALHLFRGFDEEAMLATIAEDRCTATGGFDVQLLRLIRRLRAENQAIPFTKVMISPGIQTRDYLTEIGVVDTVLCYATDVGDLVTMTDPQHDSEIDRYSHGRPLPGVEVKICDPATGEHREPGSPGEIRFRGWPLFSGFHRMSSATEAYIDSEGYFCTGDYGWLDPDGYVYYRGRYGRYIQSGGEAVPESEVERFLETEVEGVRSAAVIGVPDQEWGERVAAFIEMEDPAAFDEEQLRNACRDKLARFKIPKRFFLTEASEWPLDARGDIDKETLRERATALSS